MKPKDEIKEVVELGMQNIVDYVQRLQDELLSLQSSLDQQISEAYEDGLAEGYSKGFDAGTAIKIIKEECNVQNIN